MPFQEPLIREDSLTDQGKLSDKELILEGEVLSVCATFLITLPWRKNLVVCYSDPEERF